MIATVRARANIALAKYWGKSDESLNLPAVPSVSITLDPLVTETTVEFGVDDPEDTLWLAGEKIEGRPLQRVMRVLDEVRRDAGIEFRAKVTSVNHFPTASGLASSASGFAALAGAAYAAAGVSMDAAYLSQVARRQSASAARSVFGGFVYLPAGSAGVEMQAKPLYPPDYWAVRIVVAVTREGEKEVSSTRGMMHTQHTSPYFGPWVQTAHGLCDEILDALAHKDLQRLGEAAEQSAFAMHASAMASRPPIVYWLPASIQALQTVRSLRAKGISAWATMDAGPHVKVLCAAGDVDAVNAALSSTPGVLRTLVASPGPGLEVVRDAAHR
jgi:diphosphomevalonate decarboxylase